MKVLYRADFESNSGYARAARAHAKALIEAGVDVLFERHRMRGEDVPLDEWWRTELVDRSVPEAAQVKIWHETPEFYSPSPAQLNVAMVAWETDKIPNVDIPDARHNWTKQLNKMDLVWTFCQSAKKAMETSGVTTPVEVLPHPVSPGFFVGEEGGVKPLYSPDRDPLPPETFKFLSVFQWIPRKDPMRLLLAYLTEFEPSDNVVLILRTFVAQTDVDEVARSVAQVRQGILLEHPHPRVLLVPTVLTDDQMRDLYRSVDCFVTASRGEGFGLPAYESLACGTPVIAPNHTGFKDHITEDVGYLVNSYPTPVSGQPWAKWYYGDQTWNLIDVMHLRERMREAYSDRVGLANRAQAAPGAVSSLSPAHVGQAMRESLQALVARSSRQSTRTPAPTTPRVTLT